MRQIDRLTVEQFQIPSLQLMQSAAEACFTEIKTTFGGDLGDKKALILCGPGNNGGDGAALAKDLAHAGVHTDIVLFGRIEDSRGDARTNFDTARNYARTEKQAKTGPKLLSFTECLSDPEWKLIAESRADDHIVVDALFGTGLARPLEGLFTEVVCYMRSVREIRERSLRQFPIIFAVDIPSGLNSDLATPIGEAVEADVTITFTAPKPANVLPPASHLNGKLVVADIGSPSALIEKQNTDLFVIDETDVRRWLTSTRYKPDSFKNSHGHVLVIAGSRGYTGAAVLCANAAMRSGAGLTTVATPASAQNAIAAAAMPEVMTVALAETDRGAVSDDSIDHIMKVASKATVIAIGPGLSSEDERTRRLVHEVVRRRQTPVVVDADGLNCLSPWPEDLKGTGLAPLVLTPHPGEMLRLLGSDDKAVLNDRVAVARDFATLNRVILVLKGSRSLVAAPDGRVFINPTGNPGLGTAGSGDTLTGIVAGFLAQTTAGSYDEADALFGILAALYLGGLAADFAARDLGMRFLVASDIREYLSDAILAIDPDGEMP